MRITSHTPQRGWTCKPHPQRVSALAAEHESSNTYVIAKVVEIESNGGIEEYSGVFSDGFTSPP